MSNPFEQVHINAQLDTEAKKNRIRVMGNKHAWYHYDGVESVQRPTERQAFNNVLRQADLFDAIGLPDLDDDQWTVYLKDVELRYRNQNSNFVLPSDIARALPMYSTTSVSRILDEIDMVFELRLMLSLPTLPPIPFKFVSRHRKLETLRKAG